MGKKRLDLLLTEKGLFATREKARTNIMAGLVLINNKVVDKPGSAVDEDAEIRIKGEALPYVSRGGLKLARALEVFNLKLSGLTVLDIGASTGGFTDCALQNGAAKVFAVDVGYGQLAWKLRQDPRVVNLERTNIRFLKAEQLTDPIDLATVDTAFISLDLVLPKAAEFVRRGGRIIALVKPQFEAGRDKVGKKGVVRDQAVHLEVLEKVVGLAQGLGLLVRGISWSPVKGPEGNIEYLAWLEKCDPDLPESTLPNISRLEYPDKKALAEIVRQAHAELD